MRSRLYEPYTSQHVGSDGGQGAALVYRRDIRLLLPPPAAGSDADLGCVPRPTQGSGPTGADGWAGRPAGTAGIRPGTLCAARHPEDAVIRQATADARGRRQTSTWGGNA